MDLWRVHISLNGLCILLVFVFMLSESAILLYVISMCFSLLQATDTSYEIIRFNFESNQGNPAYTCVYRVRVHGH